MIEALKTLGVGVVITLLVGAVVWGMIALVGAWTLLFSVTVIACLICCYGVGLIVREFK